MLTEKDYCDYDTCVALKKLGYKEKTLAYYTSEGFFHWVRAYIYDVAIPDLANSSNKKPYKHIIDAMSLYEAQKWLREEKTIIIEATFNLMYKGQPRFSWRVLYNLTQHKGAYYTLDSVMSKEDYDSYEEALSEGVRKAIEILKENETIHR